MRTAVLALTLTAGGCIMFMSSAADAEDAGDGSDGTDEVMEAEGSFGSCCDCRAGMATVPPDAGATC